MNLLSACRNVARFEHKESRHRPASHFTPEALSFIPALKSASSPSYFLLYLLSLFLSAIPASISTPLFSLVPHSSATSSPCFCCHCSFFSLQVPVLTVIFPSVSFLSFFCLLFQTFRSIFASSVSFSRLKGDGLLLLISFHLWCMMFFFTMPLLLFFIFLRHLQLFFCFLFFFFSSSCFHLLSISTITFFLHFFPVLSLSFSVKISACQCLPHFLFCSLPRHLWEKKTQVYPS